MKKYLTLILSALVLIVAIVPNQNLYASMVDEEITNNSEVRINEIDKLIDKRTEALLTSDFKLYNKINNEVKELGVEEITLDEVVKLTESSTDYRNTYLRSISSDPTIRYEKTNYTYSSGGKTYDIMKITATPLGQEGLLYKTGTTVVENSSSASANSMKFIGIGVSSLAGVASSTISIVQTIYSAIKDFVSVLTPTSTIKNIKASYTWNTAETCSFIYIFDKSIGSYKLGARYHKVSSGLGVSVPNLVVNGGDSVAVVNQWNKSGIATPVNYDSTSVAVDYFRRSSIYTSSISKVLITGIEGKIVNKVYLRNPQNPREAGY